VWCELVHDVARRTGEVRLKVAGASMLPTIWPGDLVTVQRCEFSELRLGQIILHGQREKLTLHRIARIDDGRLITRGDSLPLYDPPVMPSEVLGQVVSISRGGQSIKPEQRVWHRAVASTLRRSRFLRRAIAYVSRRLRGNVDLGTVQMSASPMPAAKQ